MNSNHLTQVVADLKSKTIHVSREFNAPVEKVWRAYTESALLDQWWGPAPWRAETKFMDFSVGGFWLYAMIGPEGEKHWGRMNYIAIDPHKSFQVEDVFCDEDGNTNTEFPTSSGINTFSPTPQGTLVEFNFMYPTEEALKTVIEMGMEGGIRACFEQLAVLLHQNNS